MKAAIESCIFSASSTDRYEEAMTILKDRYGQKNGVIGRVGQFWPKNEKLVRFLIPSGFRCHLVRYEALKNFF